MSKIILTVGISSSGKTTWAEDYAMVNNYFNINRDDIRFSLFTHGVRNWSRYKFNRKNENKVSEEVDNIVNEAAKIQAGIIISDTNLNPKTRNKWREWALENNYQYEEIPFIVSWEEARKRNQQREGGISESVLWGQYLRMNEYVGRKTYTPNTNLPKAIIVDVDGTVADMTGIRKPYEWDKVNLDKPREFVVSMVNGLMNYFDIMPVFVSGRDAICKDATYDWIYENVMFGIDFHLFIREQGDMRKDKIVKEEIFWKYIAHNFNVVGAIDDRESILDLWRELGISNIIDVSGDRHNVF